VPQSYDRAKPTPLVISMHGAAGWPAQQKNLSGWNRLAESQGFIVVYPSGSDVPKIWHVDRGAGLVRDVAFISALIDTLEAAYNIDPTRIYANGLSAGGGMAFVLSCTLSDRIAGVGLVAPDVTRIEYTRCAGDATVVLYTIQGGGHSWPGGKPLPEWWVGPTSRSIDATSQMWTFFREHHLLRK